MATSQKIGVYTLGTYDVQKPSPSVQAAMLNEAKTLAASDFNLVMLASMQVHSDGSLYFNDTPMITSNPPAPSGQLSPNLPQCFNAITANGGNMLASFGGGGEFNGNPVGYWDFSAIKTLIGQYPNPTDNPFFQNLACLFATYPQVQGIDLDLECNSEQDYDLFTSTLVTVIKWVVANGGICTLCPYEFPDFWTNVVTQAGGASQIAWVNLQNATGTMSEFVGPLQGVGIGVGQIVGGLQVGQNMQPFVTQAFGDLAQQYPGVGGGWLWNLEQFGAAYTTSYAAALAKGLAS